MNPEQPSREQIEIRITALLLGELPADEAALLRYTMAQDPELQRLHDKLKSALGLVREAAKNPGETRNDAPLQLSVEKRQKLLAHFRTPRPAAEKPVLAEKPLFWLRPIKRSPLIPVLVCVALMAVLAVLMLPVMSSGGGRSAHGDISLRQAPVESKGKIWSGDNSRRAAMAVSPQPTSPPEVVTVQPEPVIAPPPAEIVLPRTDGAKDTAAAKPTKGGVYSQNIVGYVNVPKDAQTISLESPNTQTAPGITPSSGLQDRTVTVEKQWGSPHAGADAKGGSAQEFAFSAGAGGTGDGGGGGTGVSESVQRNPIGSAEDESGTVKVDRGVAVREPQDKTPVFKRSGTYEGFHSATPIQASPKVPESSTIMVSAGTVLNDAVALQEADTSARAKEESELAKRSLGRVEGVLPESPAVNPTPAATPETAGNMGGLAYITPQPGQMDKKVPNIGDIPEVGRLFRGGVGSSDVTTFSSASSAGGTLSLGDLPRRADSGVSGPTAVTSPAAAPPDDQWAAGATVRGFYDDNKGRDGDAANEARALGVPQGGMGGGGPQGNGAVRGVVNAFAGAGGFRNQGRGGGDQDGAEIAVRKLKDIPSGAPSNDLIEPSLIDFEGINLGQTVDIYAKLANRTPLSTNLPDGQVIIRNSSSMTKADARAELAAILAVNGVALVDTEDNHVKAIPSNQAGAAGEMIGQNEAANSPTNSPYVTEGVQLRYIKPSELVPAITPLAGLTNSILPLDSNGIIVLRDSPENLQRMLKMIREVDVNVPTEYISEVISLANAKADDVANALRNQGLHLTSNLKVVPKGNSLLVYASRTDMEVLKNAISKLDTNNPAEPIGRPSRQPSANAPVPQPEILTSSNAFSTFSLNVSDVSFKFAQASLDNNRLPDPASIRSEEFINAFDYRDPEAAPGQPLAFAAERARYPFAHNRELLRFAVKAAAAGRPAGQGLNLVLLLDNSGSMERADRVAIMREALRVLASQLQPQDTVSVVTFARTARLWADGVRGDKAGETLDQVEGITPDGGTNLEEAMRLAYETAHRHYLAGGLNRVVLLTDGAANLGNVDPETLKQSAEAQRKQGIALDCFGIGWEDYNDDLLEQLSSNGGGRYAFLNSPEDAARDFGTKLAGALQIAAADVKVQVEFNPARVISYRQIGYAKHQLTKEQFRDNTVAAGAIAAQEAGNALYTIETNPNGDGPVATVHVRYRVPGTQDYREHSWDVAYTGSAPPLEASSPAMRLAGAASAFSEWLAASPYAQEVSLETLLNLMRGVPAVYGADERPKNLVEMIQEAKSLAGTER